jgi:hypothetical protein
MGSSFLDALGLDCKLSFCFSFQFCYFFPFQCVSFVYYYPLGLHSDANQIAQELREKDMGYFEGAVTFKTPKDVLGFDNIQA